MRAEIGSRAPGRAVTLGGARWCAEDHVRGRLTDGLFGDRGWENETVVQDPSRATADDSRNPYRVVLSKPGALNFSAAAVVARLPMSMVGIGIVLMIQGIYGSYALAGRVSAAYVIAQAIASPQIARYVDRIGQAKVMRPMLVVSTAGLVGLILAAVNQAPEVWLYATAIVAGASIGSYGSMVRARWTHTVSDPRELHTAYSLESALDELVFVVGPVLATLLATEVTDSAGIIVPAIAAVVGGVWFLAQRRTEPPVVPVVPGVKHGSAMRSPGMVVLAVVFVAMGFIFGATDVSTIAFAEEQGSKSSAGLILAVFAMGSLISGLAYGARHWVSPLWKRFAIGMVALALGVSLFFVVTSLPMLAVVMFITGFAIAPTLINGNALVQNLVTPHQLTEGLAWVGTSLGVGVSFGASIAGSRIDAAGAHAGFQVVMIAGAVAVVAVLASTRVLRRGAPREETVEEA
jgi:MFS family permease